jgi:DUF971 family protein
MDARTTPTKLNLKRDEKLEIDWQDGLHCAYTISYLRTMCPCASCKIVREGTDPHDISPGPKRKPLLTILPGNYSTEITVTSAELVGNYAMKIAFSDGHDTGIFSFEYLRAICPQ